MTDRAPARSWSRTLRDWAVNLALILAVFLVVQWWQGRPLASGAAPPLIAETLDGATIDLASLKGRPVLVYFWASWCPSCKLVNGSVDDIAKDYPVLAVAMQSGDAAELRRFMTQAGLGFTVLSDPDGRIAGRWGVRGVPSAFVVDAAGRIAYATAGISTEIGLRARLWAAGHLGAAGPAPDTASAQASSE